MKEYRTANGEILLYLGDPKFSLLDALAEGPGDLWHSGLDQGYKNAFKEIIYQTATFWWYLNDFEDLDECISWRPNPNAFVIRKSAWVHMNGLDENFGSKDLQVLDLAYQMLRDCGGIPLYVKGLFPEANHQVNITAIDRYGFYLKHFKKHHSWYMLLRQNPLKWLSEWWALNRAKRGHQGKKITEPIPPRPLRAIEGQPKVSAIIPTMGRQDFVLKLLDDLSKQSWLPYEVVVVDATPEKDRDQTLYASFSAPFHFKYYWQTSKGSCRARNEAIAQCEGDYVLFFDDDVRVPPTLIENHLKVIQTYRAAGNNGLDIRAKRPTDDLDDLKHYLDEEPLYQTKIGATQSFSNANSFVAKSWVDRLHGNDINYDGGYGEDGDFGIRLVRSGAVVLFNSFATNLHLKPPAGGYRWWGEQAKVTGKKRKKQPWEMDHPVGNLTPVPSPTVMYQIMKFHSQEEVNEYKWKYFFIYLFKSKQGSIFKRFLRLPKRLRQFKLSQFYANQLLRLGMRYE
ncbi:glycosyltransferase family 2 protein [Croceiramulus getboli]|nr:glycosyltransferase [Flavobacteriaceae bacterium YJPT1-3]